MNTEKKKIYWLDLETTGLDPCSEAILEIAVSVADFDNPFGATPLYHAVLPLPYGTSLDPLIVKMHTDSGLLAECGQRPGSNVVAAEDIERDLLARILPGKHTLAGNSIHFDLAFLREHMPLLADRFSHRLYDVSAINLFCLSMGMPELPKLSAHRAKDDVEASITQALLLGIWLCAWGQP